MISIQRFFSQSSPFMLSVFRIITALLFMQHGGQKLLNFPPSDMPIPMNTMSMTSGGLELIGGFLLLIGLFVRPTAFILAGEMAVAYFMVHFPMVFKNPLGIFPIVNHGELAVLFCFTFLYLFFAGGGKISLDYLIWGKTRL